MPAVDFHPAWDQRLETPPTQKREHAVEGTFIIGQVASLAGVGCKRALGIVVTQGFIPGRPVMGNHSQSEDQVDSEEQAQVKAGLPPQNGRREGLCQRFHEGAENYNRFSLPIR